MAYWPCLDFYDDAPYYWLEHHRTTTKEASLLANSSERPISFLDEDFCAIDDRDFFVRGVIHLPIIGTAESLRWGVWGSLSRENFRTLLSMRDDSRRVELPSMFSWLSSQSPSTRTD